MDKQGYVFTNTGGGCTAWVKTAGNKSVYVTLEAEAPSKHFGQIVTIGIYENDELVQSMRKPLSDIISEALTEAKQVIQQSLFNNQNS